MPCRYDVADFAAVKSQFQIASEKGMSQAMFDVDLKVRLLLLLLHLLYWCCFLNVSVCNGLVSQPMVCCTEDTRRETEPLT